VVRARQEDVRHVLGRGHHDLEFPHLWTAAAPGVQEELVASEPDRFFRPPYVGHRGWLGVRMDREIDWAEIDAICTEAYRCVAPKTLVARLDAAGGSAPQ
jgi:hypothetical protein